MPSRSKKKKYYSLLCDKGQEFQATYVFLRLFFNNIFSVLYRLTIRLLYQQAIVIYSFARELFNNIIAIYYLGLRKNHFEVVYEV